MIGAGSSGARESGTRHERRGRFGAIASIAVACSVLGCAWVEVDPGAAERVRVASADEVVDCERVGTTKARTKAAIGFVKRNEQKVADELATLARNDAPELGGDTIVADGPIDLDGTQRFSVYDCRSGERRSGDPVGSGGSGRY